MKSTLHFFVAAISLVAATSAANWDAKSYSQNSQSQYNSAMELLKQHKFAGNEHVLDLGSGDGKITVEIAEKMVPKGSVMGVDVDAQMTKFAIDTHGKGKLRNLQFIQKDAAQIEFNNQFDIGFSSFAFHWVPQQQELLDRTFKALKPNGKLLVVMPGALPTSLAKATVELMKRAQWKDYFADFKEPWVFFTPQAYDVMLDQAGFVNVHVESKPATDKFANVADLIGFMRQWLPQLRKIPAEMKDTFMAELMAVYTQHEKLADDGSVLFPKTVLVVSAQKPAASKDEL